MQVCISQLAWQGTGWLGDFETTDALLGRPRDMGLNLADFTEQAR